MSKVSSILIGLVIVGTLISLFGLTLTEIATETGQTYDNNTFSGLNRVSDVQQKTNQLKANITQLQTSDSTWDKLEAFFGAGYSAFSSSIVSFGVAEDVATAGVNKLNLGDSTFYLTTMIDTIIAIILVFILLKVILKTDV